MVDLLKDFLFLSVAVVGLFVNDFLVTLEEFEMGKSSSTESRPFDETRFLQVVKNSASEQEFFHRSIG